MLNLDKNCPTEETIEAIRRRFPVETEIDRVLTRKMRRRPGVTYSPLPLEVLRQRTEAMIKNNYREPFEISDVRWLYGGASKLQMAFSLSWDKPSSGWTKTPMVLRMDLEESVAETSRLREFQIIKALEGVVPVPPVYWVDKDAHYLPYPGLIFSFMDGVTKPSYGVSNVSGTRTNVGPRLRKILAPQFLKHLGLIHTYDFTKCDLSSFDNPGLGTKAAEWLVNWGERVWEEDSDEDVPLMRYAATWLRENLPSLDHLSLVHGDYRTGNFLFNEEDGQITAYLDWELGHIGDRHEDLAWIMNPIFAHMSEDGKDYLVCGLVPEKEFLEAYEKSSGLSVNSKSLHFYKVMCNFRLLAFVLGTGYRIAHGGKTHEDVLITWLMGASALFMNDLCLLLEKGV